MGKVTGSSGRFGAKYGRTIRSKIAEIEKRQRKKHTCPYCKKKKSVKRMSAGIWFCRKCKAKFAGKAYEP